MNKIEYAHFFSPNILVYIFYIRECRHMNIPSLYSRDPGNYLIFIKLNIYIYARNPVRTTRMTDRAIKLFTFS